MPVPTVANLVQAMSEIAPPHLAEPWDNVGLLLGDPAHPLSGPTLLTIDLTEPVADEALRLNASAIVSYHPPIFAPINRLTAQSPHGRTLLKILHNKLALHSPHTALDAAEDGTTEWLIRLIAPDAPQLLAVQPHDRTRPTDAYKIVVFVPADPPDLLATVRDAMAAAGAGNIGNYTHCAFAVPGTGSFKGNEHANPAVGKAGQLEQVNELRLETACSAAALAPALAAMHAAHPYDEPAFDVIRLGPRPDQRLGAGRITRPPQALRPTQAAARLRSALAGAYKYDVTVHLATRNDSPAPLVAAVPGSGGSLLNDAADQGCTLFITGEMKHHEVLSALDRGCSVILAGHTETERGYLPTLANRLEAMGINAVVSEQDRSPLRTA